MFLCLYRFVKQAKNRDACIGVEGNAYKLEYACEPCLVNLIRPGRTRVVDMIWHRMMCRHVHVPNCPLFMLLNLVVLTCFLLSVFFTLYPSLLSLCLIVPYEFTQTNLLLCLPSFFWCLCLEIFGWIIMAFFVFLCFDLLRAIFEQPPEESYYCILGTEERSHGPSASTVSIQVRANVFRQQRALTCLVPLHVEIFFLEDLSESFLGFILLIFSPFVLSYILCFIIIF